MTTHFSRLDESRFVAIGELVADLTQKLAAARTAGAVESPELYTPSAIRRRALDASRRYVRPIDERWDFGLKRYVDQRPAETRRRIFAEFRSRYPYLLRDAARYLEAAHRNRLERLAREVTERAILAATEPAGPEVDAMRQEIWVIDCFDNPKPEELERKEALHHAIQVDAMKRRVAAMKKLGFR